MEEWPRTDDDDVAYYQALWEQFKEKHLPNGKFLSDVVLKDEPYAIECLPECVIHCGIDNLDMRAIRIFALMIKERLKDPTCDLKKLNSELTKAAETAGMIMYGDLDYTDNLYHNDRVFALKTVRQNCVNYDLEEVKSND